VVTDDTFTLTTPGVGDGAFPGKYKLVQEKTNEFTFKVKPIKR
jgi:hypothetical protein